LKAQNLTLPTFWSSRVVGGTGFCVDVVAVMSTDE
jgi:hypothetical protein